MPYSILDSMSSLELALVYRSFLSVMDSISIVFVPESSLKVDPCLSYLNSCSSSIFSFFFANLVLRGLNLSLRFVYSSWEPFCLFLRLIAKNYEERSRQGPIVH